MSLPGQPLNFNEDNLRNLGGGLVEIIDELESQHRPLFDSIDVWWDWYEAKPLHARRTEPWDGASNVIVPLIRTHADAIAARYTNTILATNQIWSGRSQNEDFRRDFLPHIVAFLNWAARNEFDIEPALIDWLLEMVVVGSSVLQLTWSTREKFIFFPGEGGSPTPRKVSLGSGPVVRHVPRKQILWQVGVPIEESDIVARQSFQTWSNLVRKVQTDGFDKDVLQQIHGSVSDDQRSTEHAREGTNPTTNIAHTPYDIREVYVDQPLMKSLGVKPSGTQDPNVKAMPLIVTLHKDTGKVLRAISFPYFIPSWSFYESYFRKRPGRGSSTGVAKMLEHFQRASSTLLNQAIDQGTLANSYNIVTTDESLATKRPNPARPTIIDNIDAIKELKLTKNPVPDITLMTAMFAMGERLTGINDPGLGRETRLGGHPSPATSTLALLQESSKLFAAGLKTIRRQVGRLGQDIATMYQQFQVEDGKLTRALGPEDGQKVQTWMFPENQPLFGNLELDIKAISDVNNPQVEQQRAIMLDQLTANYYTRVLQFLEVSSNPQAPPEIKAAAQRAIEALTESFRQVLDASEIDEIEDFVFQLKEANDKFSLGAGGPVQGGVQNGGVPAAQAGPNGAQAAGFGAPGGAGPFGP